MVGAGTVAGGYQVAPSVYPRPVIRLARPWIGEAELDAVRAVLESGMLVQGEQVAAFEARLAERCGRRHAVAVGSGTGALELALEALEVVGGEVLCPVLTWPSPAHAILRRGATPVLYDVDLGSFNGTAEGAAAARSDDVVAEIAIDQFGLPAPQDDRPADAPPLIVDAACSIGATVDGRPAASRGAIACLSFHPRKLLTTGEGGACLTDDDALADRLRMLRNHGQRDGRFDEPAGNHRMTEMAAAMGLAQLDRLDAIIGRRRAIADRYRDALGARAVQRPIRDGVVGNDQTFGILVEDRDAAVAALRADGVEAGRLSFAIHRVGSVAGRFRAGSASFANAERIEAHGVALPLHPQMSDEDADAVIEAFRRRVG